MTRHYTRKPIGPRFWSKVIRVGKSDCWEWQAATNNKGYGLFWDGSKLQLAHRVAFEWANGPIPSGMEVLHRCDNPRCVNDHHLFTGTDADNIADMKSKGRMPRGTRRPNSKLTEDKVREIRRRFVAGETKKQLAAESGVSEVVVRKAIKRSTWKHV